MAPRYFTPEDANQAVAELRPVVEQMVEHRRRFLDAKERRAALTEQAGSNGGDLTPGDFAEVEKELEEEATTLAVCIERIQSDGSSTSPPFARVRRSSCAGDWARRRSRSGMVPRRASQAGNRSSASKERSWTGTG